MKHVLLLTIGLFIFSFGFSQISIEDTENTSLVGKTVYATPDVEFSFYVRNNGNSQIVTKLKVTSLSNPDNGIIEICYGSCVPEPTVGQIIGDITIAANGLVASGLHCLLPATTSPITITMEVYESGNPSNSASFTLTTDENALGLKAMKSKVLFRAYPNPAKGYFNISYNYTENFKGTLELHNIIGKEIKKVDLASNKGEQKIDVNGLQPGVYFYTLLLNSEAICTKKLIITN